MRGSLLVMISLVASASALAVAFWPSAEELALVQIEDGNVAAASEALAHTAAADERPTTLAARIRVLIQTGEIEQATQLLEGYDRQHPDDLASRALLADLYGDAQMPRARLRELRILQRAAPDAGHLRELETGLAYECDTAGRIAALAELVQRPETVAADYLNLAYLLAASDRQRAALAVLDRLQKRQPGAFNSDVIGFRENLANELLDGDAAANPSAPAAAGTALRLTRAVRSSASAQRLWHAVRMRARGTRRYLRRLPIAAAGAVFLRIDAPTDVSHAARSDAASATALLALERLSSHDPDQWLANYVEQAAALGARDRMLAFLARGAADRRQPATLREPFGFALLEQGPTAASLPALESLADDLGDSWESAYTQLLAAMHRGPELRARLAARAARPARAADERRGLAWQLLELGAKPEAERIFKTLAAGEPADGPDVEVLLSLWGPRPQPAELDWLEARARGTKPADRAGWMRRLTAAGAHDRALAMYAATPEPSAPMREAWLEALAARADHSALGTALAAELERLSSTGDVAERSAALASHAALARDAGLTALAEQTYRAWTELARGDATACRGHALAALANAQNRVAAGELKRCRALGPLDLEATMAVGEIASAQGEPRAARHAFEEALTLLDAQTGDAFALARTRAHLLDRLGRTREADRLYTSLLGQRPADLELRADWAEMLLNAGAARRALEVATSDHPVPP